MNLDAIIEELRRRTGNYSATGWPGLEETPSSRQLQEYARQVSAEYAKRLAENLVPEPIRQREQLSRTNPAAAAQPFTSEEIKGSIPHITAAVPLAYHGSPHEFEKFDTSRIGTGQGAQSYGHGLYFAENPEVAKSYEELLPQIKNIEEILVKKHGMPKDIASWAFTFARPGAKQITEQEALENLRFISPKSTDMQLLQWFRTAQQEVPKIMAGGKLYRVNIPDEQVAKMLDWDKPLSEQPEIVKLIDEKLRPSMQRGQYNLFDLQDRAKMTGAKFYEWLSAIKGNYNESLTGSRSPQAASDLLKNLGIPGIKYLDQGSRGYNIEKSMGGYGDWIATNFNGQIIAKAKTKEAVEAVVKQRQTSNFVVFDPAILEDTQRMK